MKINTFLASTVLSTTANIGLTKPFKDDYSGTCPIVWSTPNFNLAQYIAEPWWTVAQSPFVFAQPSDVCVSGTYKESENYPGYLNVFNSWLSPPSGSQDADYENWTRQGGEENSGLAIPATNNATLSVTFPYPRLPNPADGNYIVYATDNDNYAFVFGCTQVDESHYNPIFWLLNRNDNISADLVQEQIEDAMEVMENDFGWSEAVQFFDSVYAVPVNGCPAIPDFTEAGIDE